MGAPVCGTEGLSLLTLGFRDNCVHLPTSDPEPVSPLATLQEDGNRPAAPAELESSSKRNISSVFEPVTWVGVLGVLGTGRRVPQSESREREQVVVTVSLLLVIHCHFHHVCL